MTSQNLGCAALAACFLAAPAASAAQDDRADRQFSAVWMVEPNDQPLGPRSVDDGELVFRNRLLPLSLVELTADAVAGEGGRVVVESGTQLFGVATQGPPIYCVVGRREPSAVMRILWHGGNRQICLVDFEKDGTFDAHFAVGNAVMGVPNFSGLRPRNPDAVSGGAYRSLRPDQIGIEYFVGVKYDGVIGILRRRPTPVFSIVFGSDRSEERLTEQIRPVRDSDPFLVRTPLMAEFTVTALRDDVIDIDVTRSVPAQPFHVVRTVTYR